MLFHIRRLLCQAALLLLLADLLPLIGMPPGLHWRATSLLRAVLRLVEAPVLYVHAFM